LTLYDRWHRRQAMAKKISVKLKAGRGRKPKG